MEANAHTLSGMSRIDDAFSWDGDEDPTLDPGAAESARSPEQAERGPVRASDTADLAAEPDAAEPADDAAPDEPERRRMGDVALVALGVIGGVYALWTAGWVGTVLRMRLFAGDAMFYASAVLAIVAPVVWFICAWVLTRRRPALARFASLLAGAVVLVPWPFLMLGAVGA